jgi:lipid II isoglutaminyl synthase (glutamine-hydrolysing)
MTDEKRPDPGQAAGSTPPAAPTAATPATPPVAPPPGRGRPAADGPVPLPAPKQRGVHRVASPPHHHVNKGIQSDELTPVAPKPPLVAGAAGPAIPRPVVSVASGPALPSRVAGVGPALGVAPASADHKPIRIAHLYPSLLNVAGDGGNLLALERRSQWRGIPVETVAIEKGEQPDFRTFDIILFHGGQDVEMAVVASDLARKTPSLREAADAGVVIFAVCAGLQLLGHRYVSNAGEEMLGAGILDLETFGGPQRFMQHAACEVTIDGKTETVVGFENHSGLTALGPGCEPFGRMVAGAGNNGRDGSEGARWNNVFATYLHGPVLPKNPWLTDQLLRIAIGRAQGIAAGQVRLATLDDALERRAHDTALAKAMANKGKRTALEPAKLVRK